MLAGSSFEYFGYAKAKGNPFWNKRFWKHKEKIFPLYGCSSLLIMFPQGKSIPPNVDLDYNVPKIFVFVLERCVCICKSMVV